MSKYSQLKIFHFKDKIDSLPKENKNIKPPLHIRIKPTNVCNHDCWYCSYKLSDVQLGQDMVERDFIPEDKMMEIIDDCVDMGVKAITFSGGGEPFVYKHFLKTIQKLVKYPIKFASLTNGSRLKGEVAELFAKHGTWVRVSIDGWDDESYSEYRRTGKKEFSKILQNMKDFKAYGGRCALGVSFIIDNKNYEHIYEFIKLIKSTGVDSIKISPCIVDNDGKKNNEYHKPIYNEVKRQTLEAIKDFQDESFEIYDSYHLLEEKFDKDYDWCPYSQILPIIGADLNIYPCQDKAYNLENGLVGTIKDKSLKEFWFNDKDKFFKINPKCHCNNHCVANTKNKMILDYLNTDNEHIEFV
ncbi:MAG: radical SAM protein [Candidatus Marinarcus sp.]|uniref:radical SAM protein n=1 Tax=Candidatus Marinarcus sp. TaxID=3100987 RepID=UPI003AFFA67E